MKESKKQIKAQIINEVKKQYDAKLKHHEKDCEYWRKRFFEVLSENEKVFKQKQLLNEENLKLKEKISQYEEWIERMQDFCNLSEEDRHKAFATYIDKVKHTKALEETLSFFNRLCSSFYY